MNNIFIKNLENILPKRKRKNISNRELLEIIPFYDDAGIFKRQGAYKNCLASYGVERIDKNSWSESIHLNNTA